MDAHDHTSRDDSTRRTLQVRVEGQEAFFDRVEDAIDDVESGRATRAAPIRGLSLPDEGALARVFAVENLRLLRVIATHEPSSMRAVAALVDRDIKNVSRNLHELAGLGLVELVDKGRAKRPTVPYDAIEVHYSVRGNAEPTTPDGTSVDG